MPNTKPDKQRDYLGEFLKQYDEYLDGNRSYNDLPPVPNGPPSGEKPSKK